MDLDFLTPAQARADLDYAAGKFSLTVQERWLGSSRQDKNEAVILVQRGQHPEYVIECMFSEVENDVR